MIKFQRDRQKRFQTDPAERGGGKRQAFGFFVFRRVVGSDAVDRAVFDRVDNGAAIGFKAQRRR